jgi:phospholipid/cholesterol/gamma-HCH transport system substrate-binding protein
VPLACFETRPFDKLKRAPQHDRSFVNGNEKTSSSRAGAPRRRTHLPGSAAMRGNVIETVMGAVVLIIAALFLAFAYQTSQLRTTPGYQVSADFSAIDGIHAGSDVRISGVKVGSVVSAKLNPKTFLATLRMNVQPEFKLPQDTVAEIVSGGLLGDKYISLVPGGATKDIPAGGKIKYTQSSVSLESLIGQTIFSPSGGKKPGESGGAAPSSGSGPLGLPQSPPAGAAPK